MSNKWKLIVAAPLLFMVLFFGQNVFSEEQTGCLTCHSAMKGKIKTDSGAFIELRVDAEKFKSSVHGFLACTNCHLGFQGNSHATPDASVPSAILSLSAQISSKFPADPVAGAACINCHDVVYQEVLGSIHGQNIIAKKQTDGAMCADCHGSPHYIVKADMPASKVHKQSQTETCGRCHGDEKIIEKYGLEGNVIESYEESFHGRKVYLGHMGAPACSNCHGSHNITSADDPDSPVFAKNKLQTCGKCHKGATEKFVPAITHKPVSPIVHYSEKALILLVLGTFAFIVMHVLLEVFSDIRDSILRKGGRE